MSIEEIKPITSAVQREFGGLNNIQLNWKPGNSWSIAQILDHLIISNRKYFDALRNAASEKYKPSLWERINPFTKYTGSRMIKNLGALVTKKYVSPMLFMPSKGMIGQDIIENFSKMQDEMYLIFLQFQKNDYKERVITSPVANLITINVNDAMEMIIGHEQRHLKQALAIKNSEGFPHK